MKKRLVSVILLLLMLGLSFSAVYAQDYRFQVDRTRVTIFISSDGLAYIEYYFNFKNDPSGHPIDFVDVGMPNTNYSLSDVKADVDGVSVYDIESSPYVDNGFAVGLGANAIQPGQMGAVHVTAGPVSNMLYFGSQEEAEEYASFQFAPSYYDSQYVSGNTDMTVTLILPPGIQTEEPRYFTPNRWPGAAEPESGYTDEGNVYYRWQSEDANSYTQYEFGAAFPSRLVPENSISRPPSGFENFIGAIGSFFTDGGGCICGFFGLFFLIFGLSIYRGIVGAKKRKLKYLPPKISIEGHGIKRGLTAVEAAILMENPMDKIMTMILFATVKKGAATVLDRDPLKLQVTEPLPEKLRSYEIDFLKAFKEDNLKTRRKMLQDMMIQLVQEVSQKMKGFSRKETIAYYKTIMEEAWKQVENAETPEVKMEKYDKYMDWTMLDRDFGDRTDRTFRSGPVFVPMWWGRYDPTFRPAASTASSAGGKTISSSGSGGGKGFSMPSLPGSAFAASVINGTQSFSAGVIGDVTSFTSAVTNKTNPIPKVSSSSSSFGGRGGGGGCACACACAGCACACAGGGR